MTAAASSFDAYAMALQRIEHDPMWGVENILRVNPDPWQEELIESVWDVKRFRKGLPTKYNHKGLNKITVRAMHGPGKTFGVATLIHIFYTAHRSDNPGLATAPKEGQLKDRLWPALRKVRNGAIEEYKSLVKIDSLRISWCGDPDWGMKAETASDPDNLAGYHANYILVVCEEASGIDEKFFPVIEGAISTGLIPILVMIGNPSQNTGSFYDSHNRRTVMEDYYQIHVSLDKTTRVDRNWVDSMAKKYGVDSPVYKIRCLGEFADISKQQLIPMQLIDNAYDRPYKSDGSIPRLRVCVDVADGGDDESCITTMRKYFSFKVLEKQEMFSFPPVEAITLTADAAERIFLANGGDKALDDFVVDCVGVGSGVASILLKRGYQVVIFKGGNSSDDPERWRNKRTQCYTVMRDEFMAGSLYIHHDFTDRWDDFIAQMCSIKYKPDAEKVDEIMTKKDMAAKGIKSPDMADSPMMGFTGDIPEQLVGTFGYSDMSGDDLVSAGYEGLI